MGEPANSASENTSWHIMAMVAWISYDQIYGMMHS